MRLNRGPGSIGWSRWRSAALAVRPVAARPPPQHEEHDFGALEVEGHMIYFKIDYFDRDLSMHSPDPADSSATQRVITIMLAEEY